MALKKDKAQYKIQSPGSIPYVPTSSYLGIAVDAFKPTLNRLQNEAEQTAAANYFQDFQIKTRDQFEKFRIDFENDPNGMKAAADTYSKTLLDNTPAAYKIQANAMLSALSQNSILSASKNFREISNNKIFADRETNWNKWKAESDFAMSLFNEENVEFGTTNINGKYLNNMKEINELAHEDLVNLVNLGKITDKDHINNVEENVEALIVSRGFNIMKLLDNNGNDRGARHWLYNFANGNDDYNVELDPNNPVTKIVNKLIKDDDDRKRIINNIQNKYEAFSKEKIIGKLKKPNIDFNGLKEYGNVLSEEQFKSGNVEVLDLADQLNIDYGSTDFKELINIVEENNRIQSLISEFNQKPDEQIVFQDYNVDPNKFATTILKNEGINNVQYKNANANSLTTAFNILSKQDVFPPGLKEFLTINPAADLSTPGSLEYYNNQLFVYQYANKFYPQGEFNDLFQKSIDNGILEDIAIKDYETASVKINSIRKDNENYENRKNSLLLNPNFNNTFDKLLQYKVQTTNIIPNLFRDKRDELHKHMFRSSDQTTWFAYDEAKLIPQNAKNDMQKIFAENMAALTQGNLIPEITDVKSNKLVNIAWVKMAHKIKELGYGINEFTRSGQPELIKQPYWLTNNENPRHDDMYAFAKSQFAGNSPQENMIKFGTSNWEDVNSLLNEYFANPNGDIKIVIEPQPFNTDEKKPAYSFEIHDQKSGLSITFEDNFKPIGDMNIKYNEGIYGSKNQLVNEITNEIYEDWVKTDWFQNLENAFDWSDVTTMNPNAFKDSKKYNKNSWFKKKLHSIIRNGVSLSDFRFHPSIDVKTRFFGDVETLATDIRPFGWLAKVMGFKGDFREIETDLRIASKKANDALTVDEQINNSQDLSDTEKVLEARFPPWKLTQTNANAEIMFKHWVKNNYNKQIDDEGNLQPLTLRTNNWGAISSDKWDGELDVNYKTDGRNFAVFVHPKHSIRAMTRLFLNHSSLTDAINKEKIPSVYSSTPTIEEMLKGTKYATNMQSYMDALDSHPVLSRDTVIDLLNTNQMVKLLYFIAQHETGKENFNSKFSPEIALQIIHEGYSMGIRSFDGKLQ
jgi:hypothetical protein